MTNPETSNAPDPTTWATLLGGWVQFAQRAVALPDDAQGQRWKDSVAPAIGLHALAMALGEIYKLDQSERALAMDRAELGIKQHASELSKIWNAEPMPESIVELLDDAKHEWEQSLHEGVVWRSASARFATRHPGEMGLALREAGFSGEVFVASPGIEMFKGAPVAWCRDRDGGQPDEEVITFVHEFLQTCDGKAGSPELMRPIHQVYRQMDFLKGGPTHDLVAPVTGDLPAGQPLLVPIISGGELGAVPLPPKKGKPLDDLEVVWTTEESRDEDPG